MQSKNKTIIKNTLSLFMRMLIALPVALYTSRVLLDVLGEVDYGVYNVVGGFVLMFTFISSSMSAAAQRFISFELGKKKSIEKVFSVIFVIHVLGAIGILIILFLMGHWFIENKLNIPTIRLQVAKEVFLFSNLSLFVTIIAIPFNALLFSYEKMGVYSVISLLEVVLKLVIALSLSFIGYDNLLIYAVLLFLSTFFVKIIMIVYCIKAINFGKIQIMFSDKKIFNEILNYSAWNLYGNFSYVSKNQGIVIVLNMFFGAVINSALSISMQVANAINGIVSNFQIALYPPVVKAYANNDLDYFKKLVFQGAKFSFVLLLLLVVPIYIEIDYLISKWLKKVPEYTILFSKFLLINLLIDCLSGIIASAVQATGKIKVYQLVVSTLNMLPIIISYFLFKKGFSPNVLFWSMIIISVISLFSRLYLLCKFEKIISMVEFIKNVILPLYFIAFISFMVSNYFALFFQNGVLKIMIITIFSIVIILILSYIIGFNKREKLIVKNKIMEVKDRLYGYIKKN